MTRSSPHHPAWSFFLLALTICSFVTSSSAQEKNTEKAGTFPFQGFLLDYLKAKYQEASFEDFLYISIPKQRLFRFVNGRIVESYWVSTSVHGTGGDWGSNKTPVGLHKVRKTIGQGIPCGGILEKREYTGDTAHIEKKPVSTGKDLVTSRILWLEGLEKGINKGGHKDSFKRYIYIHGTPEEGLLGRPASDGCIRMHNREVIQLFERVERGTLVFIKGNGHARMGEVQK